MSGAGSCVADISYVTVSRVCSATTIDTDVIWDAAADATDTGEVAAADDTGDGTDDAGDVATTGDTGEVACTDDTGDVDGTDDIIRPASLIAV